jgi:hypothetical protein
MVVMRGEESEPVSNWGVNGAMNGENELSRADQISGQG